MNIKKTLATAALGVGLGAILLPSAALAVVNISPGVVKPGGKFTISASCNAGVNGTAKRTGSSQTIALTSLKSGTAGASGSGTAPGAPGTYTYTVTCADGMNAGSATLRVSPTGAPRGGDGGKVDNGLTLAAGTALLGAAAGGYVLMRRRADATK